MNEYHKIQTVFKRNQDTNFKTVIDGKYSLPVFFYLKDNEWIFTEKIDGTNIRVKWENGSVSFHGKTDNAQIPPFLLSKLQEMFPSDLMSITFNEKNACLYGEGFGARIQKGGGNYIRDDVSFVLFDVKVGNWWLQFYDVSCIAEALQIKEVPIVGCGPLAGGINMVRDGFNSTFGNFLAEGIVARPTEGLFMQNGDRVITKIKHRDFEHLNRSLIA